MEGDRKGDGSCPTLELRFIYQSKYNFQKNITVATYPWHVMYNGLSISHECENVGWWDGGPWLYQYFFSTILEKKIETIDLQYQNARHMIKHVI